MLGDIHHSTSSMYSTTTGTSPLLGRPPPTSYKDHPIPPSFHDLRHYGNSRTQHYATPNTSLGEIPSPVFPDHHRHFHEHSDPSYYARSARHSSFTWNSSPPLPSAAIRPFDGSKHVATRSVGGGGGRYVASTSVGKPPPPSSPPCYGSSPPGLLARPKLTTTAWEDEGTLCYQVDAKGICVARRAGKLNDSLIHAYDTHHVSDNQMVNGTKLLNVVGMSRGKRDGILKNERGRVVIKVGAMHLKGVW